MKKVTISLMEEESERALSAYLSPKHTTERHLVSLTNLFNSLLHRLYGTMYRVRIVERETGKRKT